MEWEWSLVDPLVDIEEIILLCDENYGPESEGFLTRDRGLYRKNLTVAAAYQKFDRSGSSWLWLRLCLVIRGWCMMALWI